MFSITRILRTLPTLSRQFSKVQDEASKKVDPRFLIKPAPAEHASESAETRKAKEHAMYTVCDGAVPKDADLVSREEPAKQEKVLPSISLRNL